MGFWLTQLGVKKFSHAVVMHGSAAYSDHLPILLDIEAIIEHTRRKKKNSLDLNLCGLEKMTVKRLWRKFGDQTP